MPRRGVRQAFGHLRSLPARDLTLAKRGICTNRVLLSLPPDLAGLHCFLGTYKKQRPPRPMPRAPSPT